MLFIRNYTKGESQIKRNGNALPHALSHGNTDITMHGQHG
ncbi:MAG: hypothetical protein BROFUL_00330 [Candidatus Brocadia fulgida]|uniref:Uncharacterized protein n=1 Tax=Candidatus Brocadia fulgida TaxID=380242 RepID=A0A0M2UZ74_9BACT|nr:MAG: hypothetical protein BROFUL_00330 [Candidatus Brocadia fulgida]